MTIEKRAFGRLVARWRFLSHHVFIQKVEDMCMIIAACCIMHNLCIDLEDEDFPYDLVLDRPDRTDTQEALRIIQGRLRRDELNRMWRRESEGQLYE